LLSDTRQISSAEISIESSPLNFIQIIEYEVIFQAACDEFEIFGTLFLFDFLKMLIDWLIFLIATFFDFKIPSFFVSL